ncbi:MFS transporter [Eggerthella lenta]|uniref:MFS transporter n=1 Tax=Eggerthella lenta TaxID=84112 RepID=UPI003DA54E1C
MWAFYLATAVGIVHAGPLSDRRGRKWVLVCGCALFAVGSLVCMAAPGVESLAAARVFEALGFGFIEVVVGAIASDAYSGHSLKFATTLIQSVVLVGPAIAPFLGTFVILAAGWRAVFAVLAGLGIACIIVACLVTETMDDSVRLRESMGAALAATARKARVLLENRAFSCMALEMGVESIPLSAFVSVSSYIFISFFGTSYTEYCVAYATVFAVSIASPYLYMALSGRMATGPIAVLTIVLLAASGAGLSAPGLAGPVLFVALFLPCVVAEGMIRPMAYVEVLDQPQEFAGTASSVANLSYYVFFALAAVLATLPWPNFVVGIAVLALVCAAVSGFLETARRLGLLHAHMR